MKPTFILLLLLSCLVAMGQPSPINRRAMVISGLATGFPSIVQNGLAYYWVASDVAVGSTISNQWADRIQGMLSQNNVSAGPTNAAIGSGAGVWFDSTKPQWLSNDVASVAAPQVAAWWFIVKPTGTISDHQYIMDQQGTDAAEISIKSSSFMAGTAQNNFTAAISANNIYDVFVISTNNGGTYVAIYTNGVTGQVGVQSTTDSVVHQWRLWGTSQAHNTALSYHGYLMEAAYYTNYFPTAADITKNHTRSKAIYGNGP